MGCIYCVPNRDITNITEQLPAIDIVLDSHTVDTIKFGSLDLRVSRVLCN